jgi:hypothetical protein
MSLTFHARRQDHFLHRGADHHPGGERGRGLHPTPVLPPGIQAARLVQAMHGQGERPAHRILHHACYRRAWWWKAKREEINAERRALTQMLFVEGNHFLPLVRKKW